MRDSFHRTAYQQCVMLNQRMWYGGGSERPMIEGISLAVFLVVWYALMRWVMPRLGVPT